MCYPPQQYHSPHLLTKENVLRLEPCIDQIRRQLVQPFTPNMHTNSPVSPVESPVISSQPIAAYSTPIDKAEFAKIRNLYLRNRMSFVSQLSPGSQPFIAQRPGQILSMQIKALSLSVISFSTPVDKAEFTKKHYLQRPTQN